MIGPRASAARKEAREDLPELSRRERAALGTRISSLDTAITWQRVTSAQVASCGRGRSFVIASDRSPRQRGAVRQFVCLGRSRVVDQLVGQPRRNRRRDEADQTEKDELERVTVRAARTIEQLRG